MKINIDMGKVRNFEIAVSILGSMIGLCSHELRQETAKTNPDLAMMADLVAKHLQLWKERQNLRLEDEAATLQVLNAYGPIVKVKIKTPESEAQGTSLFLTLQKGFQGAQVI